MKFHTEAGVRGVTRFSCPLPADSVQVVCPFLGLSFPTREVEVALQPPSHSSAQQSPAGASAPARLAAFLQVGIGLLVVGGLRPPWLPQSSLLTQSFLEALYQKNCLSTRIAQGTVVRIPWKAHVVSASRLLCAAPACPSSQGD